MPAPCFTPLHVHSYYSLLEGVDSLNTLLRRAAACSYRTLALTDSNNLYGAVAFIEAARKHGVRPILGACLRQAGGLRFAPVECSQTQYTPGAKRKPSRDLPEAPSGPGLRCTVLIADQTGYASLCRILSRLHLQEKPSLVDVLAENAAGLHLLIDAPEL